MAEEQKNQVKQVVMQKVFGLLKKQGKNTVDGVLQFLKEKKLLDDSTEKIAKTALEGASDPKNIDYSKFADVCGTVAKEKGFDMANISKKVLNSLFGGGGTSTSAPAAGNNAAAQSAEGNASTSARRNEAESTDENNEDTQLEYTGTESESEYSEPTDDNEESTDK